MVESEEALAYGLHLVEGYLVVDSHLAYILLLSGMELRGGELGVAEMLQLTLYQLYETVLRSVVHTGIDIEQTGIGER